MSQQVPITQMPSIQQVQDQIRLVAKELKKDKSALFVWQLYEPEYTTVESLYTDKDGSPVIVFRIKSGVWMRNGHNIVHGGCQATLVQHYTSLSVIAHPNSWDGEKCLIANNLHHGLGTTRMLNAQFVQAGPIDRELLVRCTVHSLTKRNQNFSCVIYDDKNRVLVTGTHDKVRTDPRL